MSDDSMELVPEQEPERELVPQQRHVQHTAFYPTSQGGVEYQAKLLAKATVIPKMFQANMGNVMVAMDFALRLGMSPFSVMAEMYEVKGKPQFSGKFMAAIVVASGEFSRLKYKLRRDQKGLVVGCTAYTTELSTKDVIQGTEITWEMVTGEGWDSNKKWKTMREQMFKYRAAAFFVRSELPDLALGVQTQGEVEDLVANGTIVDADVLDERPSSAEAYQENQRAQYEKAVSEPLEALKYEKNEKAKAVHYGLILDIWQKHMGDVPFGDEIAQGYMDESK